MLALASSILFSALLLAGAAFDLAEHRLPQPLALALASTAALHAVFVGGLPLLALNALCALALGLLLTGAECLWRRVRGSFGQGMGDIKALLALMLVDPSLGLASYMLACLALALTGAVLGRRALPMVPFMAVAAAALSVTGSLGP